MVNRPPRQSPAALPLGATMALMLACSPGGGAAPTPGGSTPAPGAGTPTAAGSTAAPGTAAPVTIRIALPPSSAPIAVAKEEGCYEGINVEYTKVSPGEDAPLFLAGDEPIGLISPWETAEWVSQGEDMMYFSTAAALPFWNGVIVREEDKDRYASIEDLVGAKLGQPGFGTGTWVAFEIILAEFYGINAREDFELVTADPGALLGLLETGEIEGTLNFAAQSASAAFSEEFELIFSFTREWQERYGQPLVTVGIVARRPWLEQNGDVARRLIEGIDCGVVWMKENPDELREGGRYADWSLDQGWMRDEQTEESIHQLLSDGDWFQTSEIYTQEFIDAVYELILAGEGVFAEVIPPKEDIFLPPDTLRGEG